MLWLVCMLSSVSVGKKQKFQPLPAGKEGAETFVLVSAKRSPGLKLLFCFRLNWSWG
jgi:hypothetical protein